MNQADLLTVEPLSLPSIPLLEHSRLPACAAAYFVLDGKNCILYIGASTNLRHRFYNHHRWFNFTTRKDTRVSWLLCSDSKLLAEIEAFLITRFQPLFNGRSSNMKKICSVAGGILETESGFTIELESSQWLKWSETVQSFRYCPLSSDAPFTARREKDYWYAYRKQQGKLHKRYIGKIEDLTINRLEEIASLLNTPTEPRTKPANQSVTESVTHPATNDDIAQLWEALGQLRSSVQALGKLKAR